MADREHGGIDGFGGGGDIAAFLLFLVAGVAFIIAAKTLAAPAAVVTGVPIVLMILYAALLAFVPRLSLRPDQSGDNLYYLGFLYTLTSLGVSLYQFTAEGSADTIVRNFGVAIGSTITGVALRVLFGQMRRDPVEIERTARLELADAARRVRRELDSTVVEMAHFRRSQEQAVRDSFLEIAKRTEEAGNALITALEVTSRKSSEPLNAAAERTATMLQELLGAVAEVLNVGTTRVSEASADLARATQDISRSFDALTKRATALNQSDNVIGMRFDPMIERLIETLEAMARRSNTETARLGEAVNALGTIATELRAGRMQAAAMGEGTPTRTATSPYAARDLASLVGTSVPAADIVAGDAARGADEPELPLFVDAAPEPEPEKESETAPAEDARGDEGGPDGASAPVRSGAADKTEKVG